MPSHHSPSAHQHRTSARLVALPPREFLASAAVHSPLMADTLNLALWSGPTTPVTPEFLPDPAMAREAVEDLGLWPHGLTCQESRSRWLRGLRSAFEVPRLALPWRAAVHLDLVEVSEGQARPGRELEEGIGDTGRLLCWWAGLFAWAVEEAHESLASALPPAAGPRLLSRVLGRLYEALDGSRLPLDELVASALAGTEVAPGLARRRAEKALLPLLRWLSETGALHLYRPDPQCWNTRVRRGPRARPTHLVHLTPLGRFGIRRLLLAEGVPAPLAEDYAGFSAATFLDSLPGFSPEGRLVAVDTWMSSRTPAEALGEIQPAVASPGTALRRLHAVRALDTVSSGLLRQLRTLAEAVPGPTAALAGHVLLASGTLDAGEQEEVLAEHGPWAAVDQVLATASEGGQALARSLADAEADVLMRNLVRLLPGFTASGHPAAVAALRAVAEHHPDHGTADLARRCARPPSPHLGDRHHAHPWWRGPK